MENEILSQILNELKELRQLVTRLEQGQRELTQGEAIIERELTELKETQIMLHIAQTKMDRYQAEIATKVDRIGQALIRVENVPQRLSKANS